MVKIEKEYNYFKDVNPNYEEPNFCFKNRVDPDSASAKLYDSLLKLFFLDQKRNEKFKINKVELRGQRFSNNEYTFYTLFVNDEDFLLSSDYIGPSTYWCKSKTISEIDIVKESRLLGGHMLWPRGFNETINNQRGTKKGLYDRIDCTLKLLDLYYEMINSSIEKPSENLFMAECKNSLYSNSDFTSEDEERIRRMFRAFNNSYEWLKLFNNFKNFCDFFILKDSFVDENYTVISFDGTLFPVQKPSDKYRDNNLIAIKRRNNIIFNGQRQL